MAIKRMPINQFMDGVRATLMRKDGYIMGTTDQYRVSSRTAFDYD